MRQRLLNLAHARGQPMELLLTRYGLERLLHRPDMRDRSDAGSARRVLHRQPYDAAWASTGTS